MMRGKEPLVNWSSREASFEVHGAVPGQPLLSRNPCMPALQSSACPPAGLGLMLFFLPKKGYASTYNEPSAEEGDR